MSKELPYFKFHPSEWLMGDITLEKFEVQGVFINVVSYYWQRKCEVTLTWLKQRLNGAEAMLNRLIEQGLIKHDIDTDRVSINFENEQWVTLSELHTTLSESGKKGVQARLKRGLKEVKATLKHKDKDKEEDTISFETFWNMYEKKIGKPKTIIEWQKLSTEEHILILKYIPKYKLSKEKQFRKDPERFLRNKCWNDELVSAESKINGEVKHTGYIVDPNKFYNRE